MTLALALLVLQASTDSVATRVRQTADTYLAAYFERHPDEATLDGVFGWTRERRSTTSSGLPACRGCAPKWA